jgi:uncharacterized membrane protein YdjX (TVP38/TMEM64 family)
MSAPDNRPDNRPDNKPGNSEASQPPPSGHALYRWLPLVALALLMIGGYSAGAHQYLSLDAIMSARDRFKSVIDAQPVLAIAGFILTYTLAVSVSLPGASFFTLASGLMFGWLVGGLAAAVAATTGACIVFMIARSTFGETLAKRAGPQVAKMQAGFCENALSYLLFLRIVPAFPFFVVNIVPALLGIPFRTYLIGTAIGVLPGTFAFASIGSGLDSIVSQAKATQAACRLASPLAECALKIEVGSLLTPEMKIAFALLGVLSLLPVALKFWRRRQGRATA